MGEQTNQTGAVVIVDDDAAVLHSLAFVFEVDGFQVQTFKDAETLLAQKMTPCICYILDEHLPGMSGLDLYELLKSRGDPSPAILITTAASTTTRRRAAAAGMLMIEKPLSGNQLALSVLSAVSRAKSRIKSHQKS